MKTFECQELDKEVFRNALRTSMNVRYSKSEMDQLMTIIGLNGYVNGPKFLQIFYRLRFDKKDEILKARIKAEQAARKEQKMQHEIKELRLERGTEITLVTDYTEADTASVLDKVTEASVKYDRMMPGTVGTDAFEVEYMSPSVFKEQIKRVFNMRVSAREFAALVNYFDADGTGQINCAEFLVLFFRKGFERRSLRIREAFERDKRANEEREKKIKDDLAELDKRNAMKVSYKFTEEDKAVAQMKLREAAKLYNKNSAAAASMKAFESKDMLPHEFKSQLKRLFNLTLTAPQLGALMSIFDIDGDGSVSCQEFTKCFFNMGFAERQAELRLVMERQRREEKERKEYNQKKIEEMDRKNAAKINRKYTEADHNSVMAKLADIAFKYDKNLPGSPSLKAFEGESMLPHQFKEQLRAVLGLKCTPAEMGAIMDYFDANGDGEISCSEFMVSFIKTSVTEKERRNNLWRKYQADKEKQEKRKAEIIEYNLSQKNALKVQSEFGQEDFTSAMSKLTTAAMLYDRSMPGCIQLTAFECDSMPPHVFKEQLKLVFGIKLTGKELGALMSYFDEYNEGVVNCQSFVVQFLKTGFEERNRARKEYRALLKAREEKLKIKEEEKLKKEALRQLGEVDYEFNELQFDSALSKLLAMCHAFDGRTLGPAGWKAFEAATLTPSEFKEMMRRTFNIHLNPPELGAMVTYFDMEMTGMVSCFHFLNSFVQMRTKLEGFKGKPDEEESMAVYHSQLKEAYKTRVQRQLEGGGNSDAKLRPWRSALTAGNYDAIRSRKGKRRSYPKTPYDKLKRRLAIARLTGKIDLSTKKRWLAQTTLCSRPQGKDINGVEYGTHATRRNLVEDQVRQNMIRNNILFTDWVEGDMEVIDPSTHRPPLLGHVCKHANNSISSINAVDDNAFSKDGSSENILQYNPKAFDIRMGGLPKEVFKVSYLREMWLCNNMLSTIGSDIGELKQLRVFAASGCGLEKLPPEICLLQQLEELIVPHNLLHMLPDLFWKLKTLKKLDIGHNKLHILPESICQCAALQSLNISHNKIAELPDSFGELRSLTMLSASSTQIKDYPKVLNRLRTLFTVGIPKSHAMENGCMFSEVPLTNFSRPTTTTSVMSPDDNGGSSLMVSPSKKQKKKLSPDLIVTFVAPRPVIPISPKEEEDLYAFIKNRAKARKLAAAKAAQAAISGTTAPSTAGSKRASR